ncbi:MAG: ankyrin repeat domain-containing protein, partial [Alphaproteobacteria bacterium]
MDPLQVDDRGRCPLHGAIDRGDNAAIETWLREGMNPNARLRDDEPTPVQMAIESKNLPLVKLFTAYGADLAITTPAKQGRNAYHYAALATPEIMEHLLQQPQRAAAEAITEEKKIQLTPLRLALKEGDRKMTELLLDYGIDVNEQDENNETPLHFLLGNRKSREEAMPLVRLLIDRGADIGTKAANFWSESPLFPAVRDQFTEAVKLLLDLGCNAAEKNHLEETLLHAAAATYDAANVRLLIDHGAQLEEKNRIGRTALHIAAHANRLEVVKTLLEKGADPFAKDRDGKTPDELCPASFQKNVHREILRKQMELEAQHATNHAGRPQNDYYARKRQQQARDQN